MPRRSVTVREHDPQRHETGSSVGREQHVQARTTEPAVQIRSIDRHGLAKHFDHTLSENP
jgi:hypothetical protein